MRKLLTGYVVNFNGGHCAKVIYFKIAENPLFGSWAISVRKLRGILV
jgi:hypothetical protein